MHPLPATDCSLETRYDNPGRTCLATQAIAATTLRRQTVSASVHLSASVSFIADDDRANLICIFFGGDFDAHVFELLDLLSTTSETGIVYFSD